MALIVIGIGIALLGIGSVVTAIGGARLNCPYLPLTPERIRLIHDAERLEDEVGMTVEGVDRR